MASKGQGGAITSVEAFVLTVMTAILIAIAAPSYITIRDRDSDRARAHICARLREAADPRSTRVDAGCAAALEARTPSSASDPAHVVGRTYA